MSPEDRELLQTLRRQQLELQRSLARLDAQLEALERTAGPPELKIPAHLPPVPVHAEPPPPPAFAASHEHLPPVPPPFEPAVHALPPLPPAPRPSLEFRFGRWLTRIGAVFGIITLALILSLTHALIFRLLGPGGILGMSALVCVGIVILGDRLERRPGGMLFFGRSLISMGLAGLYVTLYAAHSFDSVRIIASPLAAGLLLLAWSAYVFSIADRKGSQALAVFSIALAYFSTAINPLGRFTMAADLILAGTAVLFLLRRGWAVLSYLGMLGTYFALLRRLVVDENGELVLDTSRTLSFAPYAVYLIATWVIFTGAVLLATWPTFRRGKRLGFLSLNNGAVAGLLALTTYIAGYGFKAVGWTLFWTGVVFLATAGVAGLRRVFLRGQKDEVAEAYLAQGIAVFTAGLMGIYTGVTRGMLLTVETLFLGLAAAYSRNVVLKVSAYVTALFAALFLMWEISASAHHPWLLGFGGAAVMLANAWWSRRELRREPLERQPIVLPASYYCALALGLITTTMASELSDAMLPPALAIAAVALTFFIYLLPLYELPPLAQTLLIGAQALVLFPAQTGEALPRWSTAWVAALTLVLLAWWSRQRITRYGSWIVAMNFIYALALVALSYHAVRPYVNLQDWMISASFISAGFLAFGALTRVWPLAAMGQLFLAAALYHFFSLPNPWTPFPWSWLAAAVPIAVVFATGRAIHSWLRYFPEMDEMGRSSLQLLAYGYQILALAMVARWILAIVPDQEQIATFLLSGTLLLAWNARRGNPFGVRCSFVLSALGVVLVLRTFMADERDLPTFLNGLALFSFLVQPTLLRHGPAERVSEAESWLVILASAATGWLFVDVWIVNQMHPNYVTMGWALYALFLFFFGLTVWERRQRWCGLAILVAAMVRVIFYDIWGFSNGYKVLTFVVLTLITLGLGFLYARFAERLKTWL
jgi:hypothetical protein